MSEPGRVAVDLGGRSYDILVGEGLIAGAGPLVRPFAATGRALVVTDETVAAMWLLRLEASLADAGIASRSIVLPPGEATKGFDGYRRLCEDALAGGIERSTLLIALGGGVVGDLAGFAAATLLRGLDFVQVPTTLLAQVDSSVGGKTAIDTEHGKNLVGAFHQPRLVLADTGALGSLPLRELRAGYAEVAKYGLIRDRGFFEWLERHGESVIGGDPAAKREAVLRSCEWKARIVAADEKESGERALLNFGHTFAHAIEAELGYGDAMLHGEAVAIGMVQAFELSARLGHASRQDAVRVRRHLEAVGLPTAAPRLDPERLLARMRKDKKVQGGRLTFILARGIGDAFVTRDVAEADVRAVLGAR